MTEPTDALGDLRTIRSEIRAELADIRSEMRASFAELRNGLSKLNVRLGAIECNTAGLRTTVVATGIGMVIAIIYVLAYGQTWFGIGVNTRDVIRATVAEMQHQVPPR